VKTVLDFTAGTGVQAIALTKKGFRVRGVDKSRAMLRVARRKSKGLGIRYSHGDVRSSQVGKFDAVISIFNSMGSFPRTGLRDGLRNMAANLRPGGILIFDILNFECMQRQKFWGYEFLETIDQAGNSKYARFLTLQLSARGLITVRDKMICQKGYSRPRIAMQGWNMQIYSAGQIKRELISAGFADVEFYGGPGKPFSSTMSQSMLVCATLAQ
jgi:SAM-dependent methyltransferase